MTANILVARELVSIFVENQIDCVLSALGVPEFLFRETRFFSDSMRSIVEAMNQAKIKRLICITSFYTKRKIF